MVDKKLSEMGDSELQEYLLSSGYTQYIFEQYAHLFPEKEVYSEPLESYEFKVINLKDWVDNYKKTL